LRRVRLVERERLELIRNWIHPPHPKFIEPPVSLRGQAKRAKVPTPSLANLFTVRLLPYNT
jgi:hypothetical protein